MTTNHNTPTAAVTLDTLSTTELLEANKTLLAVRQIFNLQAGRYRAWGAPGGDQLRTWAAQHLRDLDEQIFAVVMEMDNRDLSSDDDAQLERDIAIRESHDVLPIEVPWSVDVIRRASA